MPKTATSLARPRERTNRLKDWREAHGLTIQDVADLTGVSPPMLSRVEHGTRELSPLLKARIARGLGVRIAYLFGPIPSQSA